MNKPIWSLLQRLLRIGSVNKPRSVEGDFAKRSKVQKWKNGSVFLVPQSDGGFTVAQVLSHEVHAMNSALCAFTLTKSQLGNNPPEFDLEDVLSIQFVTIDLLDSGVWPVVGWMSPIDFHSAFDLERHR